VSDDSKNVFTISQAGVPVISGVNANFTIFETLTSAPPVFEFRVLNADPATTFKPLNKESYSINFIPPGSRKTEKNIMNAYINSAEYDAGPPNAILFLYFERAEYRALKTTFITKSWDGEITLSSILTQICGEAGLISTMLLKQGREDPIVKNLQFDNYTAIQCLDYLADRYGLIYFYQFNSVTFYDSIESLPAEGVTTLNDKIYNTKNYKQFNSVTGTIEKSVWVRILFNPIYKPGILITSNTGAVSGNFRLHTVIHRIIGKLFYSELLLVSTTTDLETLKFINTTVLNDVFYKFTNELRREIKREMEVKVGKVTAYNSENHLVDLAIIDASPFPSVEGEAMEGAMPVTKKQIMTQIAGDGYGLVCPSYPGERVLIARLNDHDYVVLGKVFDAGMSKPEHGEGEYVLYLPDGGKIKINADEIDLGKDASKGVARLDDEVTSDNSTDSIFFGWLIGFVAVITGTPFAGLQAAMAAYIAANPIPATITSKITAASTKVNSE